MEGTEAVHHHPVWTIVITTETEIIGEVVEEVRATLTIISTVITVVDVVRAVRPLPADGGDGANQCMMRNTIHIVAATEAGVVIIEGDDPDHILPLLRRPLHRRHPVLTVAPATVDVDHRDDDEEDPLLMIVLLVEEIVEAAEAVEIIVVAMILVETVLVPVVVGEEEEVPLLLVPDRERVQDETAVAVAVVETVITVAAVDVIATEAKGRQRKKKQPNIKILPTQGMVQKA